MLFEVLFDGKVRASTSYLECIPTKNTLLDMEHASDLFTCDRLTGSTAGKNMFYNCNSLVGGNGTKYADMHKAYRQGKSISDHRCHLRYTDTHLYLYRFAHHKDSAFFLWLGF